MLTQVYTKILENLNEEVTFLGMDNLSKFSPKGKEAVSRLILLLKAIGKLVKQLPSKMPSKPRLFIVKLNWTIMEKKIPVTYVFSQSIEEKKKKKPSSYFKLSWNYTATKIWQSRKIKQNHNLTYEYSYKNLITYFRKNTIQY